MTLTPFEKKRLLLFLEDDAAGHDVTSAITPKKSAIAFIKSNEPCTLAGIQEAVFLFQSQGLTVKVLKKDGQTLPPGKIIEIRGDNRRILTAERTALNVLSRMSGVATLCQAVQKKAGNARLALTRKTIPGFNVFDKKAAQMAGIWPHRKDLAEAVLIKENHLVFFGSVAAAVAAGKKTKKLVEIEVQDEKQATQAARANPDMILLDNFTSKNAAKTVHVIRKINPKVKIELSGGINRTNLSAFAKAKPDFISLGLLTQKTPGIDFSLDIYRT